MTRENKLALVIGFGLLLLAGILVSDHLSSGQRAGEEPLLASGEQVVPPSTLLQSRKSAMSTSSGPRDQSSGGSRQTAAGPRNQASEPAPLRQITIGAGTSSTTARTEHAGTGSISAKQPTVHYVRKGETLSAISKKYYGNAEYAGAIARSNNIANPQRIRVGTRLVIADQPGGSIRSQATTAASASIAPVKSTRRIVEVQEGETLSEIAKRELGSERKWHELWQLNKGVVPDPNRLRPGTTLNLPAT